MRAGLASFLILAFLLSLVWMSSKPLDRYEEFPTETSSRVSTSPRRSKRSLRKRRASRPEMADPAAIEATLKGPQVTRWKLVDGGHGIPPNGSAVRLRRHVEEANPVVPSHGIVHDGQVVVADWRRDLREVRAVIRGFGCALLRVRESKGVPTAFRPSGRVTVGVKDTTGKSLHGARVIIREVGVGAVWTTKTNAAGVARVSDLYCGPGALVDCRLVGWGNLALDETFRAIDLEEDDATIEHVVPAFVSVPVDIVVSVNGKPPPAKFHELANLYLYRDDSTARRPGHDAEDESSYQDWHDGTMERWCGYSPMRVDGVRFV